MTMMIGPVVNGAAVIIGSLSGSFFGHKVSEEIKKKLPMVFGCASMGLGIAMVVKVNILPVVILSLLIGSIFGEVIKLEKGIQKVASGLQSVIEKRVTPPDSSISQEEYMEKFIAVLVLFCASGTGIFGAMNEGMTGDSTMLIVKAFLDLFTAGIFAISLGVLVSTLAVPQFVLQSLLYFGASAIMPLTTPDMIADFSAVGGLIMFATGFRIAGIMPFPIANMLPSLIIVMPLSYVWTTFVL